jgi:hypothetical protein
VVGSQVEGYIEVDANSLMLISISIGMPHDGLVRQDWALHQSLAGMLDSARPQVTLPHVA